ncbi:site-specific integrase [Cellulomonas chengniuliangii]|uniref:Site-specific integrase n=1 Tax=Cellulomonas chengniuliangii TaxID=2968084 RepID=A0ABY5KVX1_9CELL|nr:site-specific integrase [Cellulomonas chengniuliangii]MCC2309784.1 site-specific integrase [Cellulomonas chengniuliangii]UUI74672.1 site-specific integrase [Cellulomonas chengniuliangii]
MTTMMSAALPATAVVHPVDPTGVMPRGLTDTDAERIAAAIAAARTESTRHVYAGVWSRWERWCAGRGVPVLPSDPLAVCAYLTEQAAAGRAMGTLDLICTVIRHVHLTCGLHNPADALAVRQVRRGLRRTYGSAPRRLARPLSVEEIRQIIHAIDRTTPIGIRDTAMILLGYASALRRSELVALTLSDIENKPAGIMLHIRRSKTDPEGHGAVVGVAHGQHAATDPVAALNAWREIRGAAPGPVFTRIWGSTISLQSLSGHVPARMLRARAEAAGLDGTRITAHSMRAGHATTAALAGVPLDRIAAQTRHKDLSVLVNRYIRPLEALATTSSKDLGL